MNLFGYSSVNDDTAPLRLINVAVGCAPVILAWIMTNRLSGRPWHAAALGAPIAGSSYVNGSASFITTDNAALACYALALFFLICHRSATAGISASLAGAVVSRQVYLPIAGALALSTFNDP
jgi:hypothetical protein